LAGIKLTRKVFQIFFFAASISLAVRLLLGLTHRTVEYYCPMGGIVSLYGLFQKQQFICALSEMNLSLALALLVTVVLTKRSFCGWVCPLGTVFESLSWIRFRLLDRETLRVPDRADAVLAKLKYVVLGLILLLTYRASELIFRGYDPFYILFTGGKGHGVVPTVSMMVIGGVIGLSFIFEMAWCRYLCPLAGAMDPFSRFGLLKIQRHGSQCDSCGACDRACPQRIPVSRLTKVRRADCTNCFECITKCPKPGALDFGT
jgi:polyferredoxin